MIFRGRAPAGTSFALVRGLGASYGNGEAAVGLSDFRTFGAEPRREPASRQ